MALIAAGGRPVLVGGSVRDYLRSLSHGDIALHEKPVGNAQHDVDVEVFGLSQPRLEQVLQPFNAILVGRLFGVYTLRIGDSRVDVSLPRRERHLSAKHNDVAVIPDATMTFAEAASRRDFTINAIGFDWVSQQFLDPWAGQKDLRCGVLRHVGAAFGEDPLRVFRAARFATRFGYDMAPETLRLCQGMSLKDLSKERIWEELVKVSAYDMGVALSWYRHLGCLSWYPELAALIGVPQDGMYHPEGDAWAHTCLVLSAMCRVGVPAVFQLELQLAALCHDLGKSVTTAWRSGRWRALGHAQAGADLARRLLSRLGCPLGLQADIGTLVKCHMLPMQLYASSQRGHVSDAAIRRLACNVSIEKLLWLATADHNGRGGVFDPNPPATAWLRSRAETLSVYHAPPKALILGRDLIGLGVAPGPEMGQLLKRLFEAQIRGAFETKEAGVAYFQMGQTGRQSH